MVSTGIILTIVFGSLGVILTIFIPVFSYYWKYKEKLHQLGLFIPAKSLREKFDNTTRCPTSFVKKFLSVDPEMREEFVHFTSREEELLEKLKQKKLKIISGEKSRGISITAEAGVGKTRTSLEVIRELVRTDPFYKKVLLLFFHPGSNIEKFRIHRKLFIRKYPFLFLFFDDIDKYAQNPYLSELIYDLRRVSKHTLLLCTYRTEEWERIKDSEYSRIIQSLFPETVTIPKLDPDQGKVLADCFDDRDFPLHFGGTAAEVVLGKDRKIEEYTKFAPKSTSEPNAQKILWALKLLNQASIFSPTIECVKLTAIKVLDFQGEWMEAYQKIRNAKFLTELKGGTIYVSDYIIENVVTNYPPYDNPDANQRHFIDKFSILQKFFFEESMWDELFRLSRAFNRYNEFILALKCFPEEKVVNILTRHQQTEYFFFRGIVYSLLKKYSNALKDYTKAIELIPEYAHAYYNRGNVYDKLDKHTEALEDYAKAIELDPEDAQAYNNRGNTYYKLDKHTEALEEYSKAIELDSKYAQAYYNRGVTYDELDKHTDALEDYSKAIELDPEYAQAYYNRGNTYYKLDKPSDALEDYNSAWKLRKFLPDSGERIPISSMELLVSLSPPPLNSLSLWCQRSREFYDYYSSETKTLIEKVCSPLKKNQKDSSSISD
ncbi:Photosystem I assembly protein Ycf3 [subsurface metagenome]